MNTDTRIKDLTGQLINNCLTDSAWNDKLLQPCQQNDWDALLMERSRTMRELYVQNEACIAELTEMAKQPMTRELADELFEAARAILLAGKLDPALICILLEPVVSYYREHGLTQQLIIAASIYNTAYHDYYGRMLGQSGEAVVYDNCRWIIQQREHYAEFTDVRARRNIFHAYSNLMFMLSMLPDEDNVPEILRLQEQMLALWNQPDVQELDGKDPAFQYIIDDVEYSLPMQIGLTAELTGENLRRYMKMSEQFCTAHSGDAEPYISNLVCLLQYRMDLHRGLLPEDAVNGILERLTAFPTPDWVSDPTQAQIYFQIGVSMLITALNMLTASTIGKDKTETLTMALLKQFFRLNGNMPFSYLNAYASDICMTIFRYALPCLQTPEVKELLLDELLIHRQPSTYLHSLMVEKIAVAIAKEILKVRPELFCSVPGYNDVDDLLQHQDEILRYIAKAARFHDTGKCCIAAVIMTQTRRLTDMEFHCIKQHPDKGLEVLKSDPYFGQFFDVIRGHHKTYDGRFGYPPEFHNTESAYHFVIDLISISDSADAATDTTGRNYTPGKDFHRLLGELEQGAGTRYNPDIVRIIADSPELIQKLTELTGEMRTAVCYEAYQACRNFARSFV